jgi:spore germination protein GerM
MHSVEFTNRVILMMSGALVLLVFMDVQAARHSDSIRQNNGSTQANEEESLETKEQINPVGEFDAKAVFRPVSDALKIDQAIEEYKTVSGEAGKNGSEKIHRAVTQSGNAIKESVKETGSKIQNIEIKSDRYYLYFIRYNGGKSELVRVERKSAAKNLKVHEILKILQEGPEVRERGLLNTFDSRIRILGIKKENGIVELNLSSDFDRMGARVVQDRLDQMILTLIQFPEIRGVKLLIDGKHVKTLAGSGISVDSVIGPPARKVSGL